LRQDIYEALFDCAAFVNWRRVEAGQPAILLLSFHGNAKRYFSSVFMALLRVGNSRRAKSRVSTNHPVRVVCLSLSQVLGESLDVAAALFQQLGGELPQFLDNRIFWHHFCLPIPSVPA